jgi:hypothetical protein
MPISVSEYLQHILDEIAYLRITAQGVSQEEFTNNATLKTGVCAKFRDHRRGGETYPPSPTWSLSKCRMASDSRDARLSDP